MIFKDFLYFLTSETGASYKVEDGVVGTSGVPTPLPITPDGWQEKSLKWGRSLRYKGLIRSFTTPLKFVKQAATIIRTLAIHVGFEAKLFLVIHRLDRRYGMGWVHKLFFSGELDMSKAQSEDDYVTCNIMEGGLDKLLKANENTQYELTFNQIIRHDGILLANAANYEILDGIEIENDIYSTSYTPPFYLVNEDGTAPGVSFQAQAIEATGNSVDYVNVSDNHFCKNFNEFPVEVKLTGKLIVEVSQNDVAGGFSFRWMTSGQNTGNQDLYNFTGVVTAGAIGTVHTFIIDDTITLQPQESLFLRGALIYPTSSFTLALKFNAGSSITAYTESRFATTDISCISCAAIGQKLIDKIAPGYYFTSSYFTDEWSGLKITSGDAIRRIVDAKLKTSFADFFDSMNCVTNCQLFIKDKSVYIERGAQAFGSTTRLSLGTVAAFKWDFANDFIFNTVKVGYPDVQLTDRNGRFEFNVTLGFTSAVTRVVKELNLVSKYRASMYEMEFIRINLEGKPTTNSPTDSTVYFIHCNETPVLDGSGLFYYHTIRRDTYDEINGLFDPASAYNIEISPKRNLLRHGDFIHSCFYFQQESELVFQTSDRNYNLETVRDATMISAEERIKEGGNIDISLLPSPIFIPIMFEFDSKIPAGIVDVMEATPSDTFDFTVEGDVMKGFPMEVSIQPANRPSQTTTLLCSPLTDITKLIH